MRSSQFRRNCGCCFAANRPLLKILFQSAGQAIMDWAETEHFRPGIVTVMHTFGSDLKFNCHIHALYTLGGLDTRTGSWRSREYLCAESIKARFKTILLACLRQARHNLIIPPEVKKIWLAKFGTAKLYEVQNRLWQMGEWRNGKTFSSLTSQTGGLPFVKNYLKRLRKNSSPPSASPGYYSELTGKPGVNAFVS